MKTKSFKSYSNLFKAKPNLIKPHTNLSKPSSAIYLHTLVKKIVSTVHVKTHHIVYNKGTVKIPLLHKGFYFKINL
ncbi:hypothetical protein EBO34_11330 [Alteribacter keqinensis]|uniref:Uncharacterized protein n=1 Tax=Alteribacter keqinensis TaxID=2483800 RepID=A0A3M7U013_9BACI|nr:hypothetical protein EBO34_11330 [Alteribacter keqinensis]